MAIAYLNPSASTTNTNWDSSTVSELDQGETSNTWQTTANSANLIVTLDDFAGLGASSITSVQLILVGNYDARSGSWIANTNIFDASDTSYYAENIIVPAGRTASTLLGTVRTTSDGSAAWTGSDLNGMKIGISSINCTDKGQLVQFYIKVIYETGYGNAVNGIAAASIGKINGVAIASIEKVNGI